MIQNRPKLVLVGHHAHGTGLGRVTYNLVRELRAHFDVTQYGLGGGEPWQDLACPLVRHPAGEHPRSLERLFELIHLECPDLGLVCCDPMYAAHWGAGLAAKGVPSVLYTPIDAPFADGVQVSGLEPFHQVVTFTDFGLRELMRASGHPRISVIPHGVAASFAQLRDVSRAECRAGLPVLGLESCDFVVLNANKNTPRKDLLCSLQGFAAFAQGKPNSVKLVLHTASRGCGRSLAASAEALGCLDRVVGLGGREHPKLSDEDLARLYRACDVGINTARGEGWGLVAFEHAATGAPQLVPGHTGPLELWKDAGLLIDPHDSFCDGFMQFTSVDPNSVANHLEELYCDSEHRSRLAQAAIAVADGPHLRWGRVGAQMAQALMSCLPGSTGGSGG